MAKFSAGLFWWSFGCEAFSWQLRGRGAGRCWSCGAKKRSNELCQVGYLLHEGLHSPSATVQDLTNSFANAARHTIFSRPKILGGPGSVKHALPTHWRQTFFLGLCGNMWYLYHFYINIFFSSNLG